MLDTRQLILMYREEKEDAADELFNRFPSFSEWKAAYMAEYDAAHSGSSFVDVELAIELTEAELDALPAG